MNVQIEAQGLNNVTTALESMASRGVRLRPLMSQIGIVLLGSVFTTFAAEGRPHWKPLSASTVRSIQSQAVQQMKTTKRYQNAKRASTRGRYESQAAERVGGNKMLQRTGDLRKSIVVGEVTEASIEIGSSLKYARIQQLGGKIPAITIRPKNKQALLIPIQGGYVIRRSANIPERTIPARPYLGVQPEDIPVISGLTMQYIRSGR